MKALILSCNTGQGHNTAGKAIKEELDRRGVSCEMLDTLTFGSKNTSVNVSGTYIRMTQRMPKLFGSLYRAGEIVSSAHRKSPVYFANRLYANRLGEFIEARGFDTVVCPHLFPAEAMTYLLNHRKLNAKVYGVATDYTCSPFWEETRENVFFIPNEALRAEYVGKGIPTERLVATGIPVSARFTVQTERSEARRQLGLPETGRQYLVMSGSMGFGEVPEMAQRLLELMDAEDHVAVLTGSNKHLEAKLRPLLDRDARVLAVPFTAKVPLYMDASDVLLTKPGGLSSTEAAVKNIPMIHTAPIPGCETVNARLFEREGLSILTTSPQKSAEAAVRLAHDDEACRRQLQNQRRFVNPFAAAQICDYMLAHRGA